MNEKEEMKFKPGDEVWHKNRPGVVIYGCNYVAGIYYMVQLENDLFATLIKEEDLDADEI
ncbi:MAG TPA: hypothetical protein PKW84_07250 [Fervidobacterium sp.]|nr:hypothetical protein [Fervidobacterium sp.]